MLVLLFSCSVVSNYVTPRSHSMPGFPVLHYLPEFVQTRVLWVGDAIRPAHPLSPPSPPASVFSSIRVFSGESCLRVRRPKYWSFSFSFSPSNEYSGLVSFRIDWFDLLAVQGTQIFSSTTLRNYQFFLTDERKLKEKPLLWSDSHICTRLLEKP